MKKSDSATAYYEVIEAEAEVVRLVFDTYTKEGLSINAIARLLNDRRIPTRRGSSRWERSTVWAMLRNPAYQGKACFGKTERAARKKITRPLRQRGGHSNRCGAHRERPRPEWIEIAVPALVSDVTFALAQEQLEKNKRHSPRRTVAPSLLQGMLVCQQCGYALYRSSAQTCKQKLYYYRCIGSDAYRHLCGPVCTNRPIRQDYLDQFVWQEIIRVLEEPELIQAEIQRRLEAAQKSDPVRKREQSLRRELTRLEASMERLLTAYQENLLTLAELRRRMPELRKQQQAIQSELTSMELAATDQSRYLRLTHTLTEFRERLHAKSETMEVPERQKILRLLVKEILVGTDTITVRHALPIAGSEPPSGGPADGPTSPGAPSGTPSGASYLLRSGSDQPAAGQSLQEPDVEGMEADRTWRTVSGADSQLRGRLRDPQSRKGERGTGVDARCTGAAGADPQRKEDEPSGRPKGTIRFSGIYIRTALQSANGAGVYRLQSVEEEREQGQEECEGASSAEQHGLLGGGSRPAESETARLASVFPTGKSLEGVGGARRARGRACEAFPETAAQGAIARHWSVFHGPDLW